ncbi:MAG: vesicle coat component [Sarcosagium campestre]|nr:MAG: vesicle coat component [Sarcosagium campestre]
MPSLLPRLLSLSTSLLLLFSALLPLTSGLKFDLQAHPASQRKNGERCIRNFVAKDTLVVVTATASGIKGDGQQVNMHIKDAVGNDYGRPRDIVGEKRMAFTSHADAAFDVCFENILTSGSIPRLNPKDIPWRRHLFLTVLIGSSHNNPSRHIELDIDIGADARDWSAIQAAEKLKPVETELRRIEELVSEIVAEMEYLRTREQKLRDTNESTNERVKWFAFGTMGMLVGLGAWQVVYLRAYFRYDLSLFVVLTGSCLSPSLFYILEMKVEKWIYRS